MLCESLATEYPSAPYTPCQLPCVAVSVPTKLATAAATVVKFTVALPEAVPSVLVAVTVTWAGVTVPGAVYKPLLEMLPEAAFDGFTAVMDHVTPGFAAPTTAAVNCCCSPAAKVTLCGLTVTPSVLPPKKTPLTTALLPLTQVTLIFT